MVRFAALAGYPQDADNFRKESELVKEAFNSKYLHTELGYYSNNTVTANILSLRFGMVPEAYKEVVFRNIVEKNNERFQWACQYRPGRYPAVDARTIGLWKN